MKKLTVVMPLVLIALALPFTAMADGHHGHRGHHNKHRQDYREGGYYPQERARYVQAQQYQDPRSSQGLVGGVVGSALGYHMGKGDPLAAGFGAAAGAFLGNKIAGSR